MMPDKWVLRGCPHHRLPMNDHPHTPEPGPEEQSATLDELLGLLGDCHRRRVITRLADTSPVLVEEFVRTADRTDPRALAIALHHNHLPKLRSVGLVTWDEASATVHRGPQFETVEPLVELFRSNQDRLPDDWP